MDASLSTMRIFSDNNLDNFSATKQQLDNCAVEESTGASTCLRRVSWWLIISSTQNLTANGQDEYESRYKVPASATAVDREQ